MRWLNEFIAFGGKNFTITGRHKGGVIFPVASGGAMRG